MRQNPSFDFNMAAYFGIHVGNSSVCIAICKDEDRVEVVANDVGDRITPALLQWTPNACTVGKTAQLELFRNCTNTILRNKQLLDDSISDEELEHLRKQVPYKINKVDSNFKYELLIDGKQFHVSPREVAGWIFKKTLSIAESAVGGKKEINVVITVPVYFSNNSIHVVKDVAKKAGFNVLQLVDEPTTAALGCGLGSDPLEDKYYCLVYRVGGYSIDVTILMVQDGMFCIINSVHKSHLGGALFTEKLAEYLSNEFKRQYKTAEISERGKYKLYAAAETIKQVLSIQNVAQCSCESVGSGYDFNCSVSRARFENIVASLISDVVAPIKEVIEKSNLNVGDIRKTGMKFDDVNFNYKYYGSHGFENHLMVVTCGGTLKTPKLQETVRKLLPSSEILVSSNPDEMIALGAAKQAGYCSRFDQLPNTLSIDTLTLSTSLSIKVEQEANEGLEFLVGENTSVPIRKRYDVPIEGKVLSVSLTDGNNTCLGTTCLNNLESRGRATIDLDINKEGKIFLTVINEENNEKNYIKYDLNETSNL